MRPLIPCTLLAALFATAAVAEPIAGVDPRVYLKARKPVPEAVRDLKAAPVDTSLAILRDGPDAWLAPLADVRDAYPKGADVDAQRALERRALVIGAVHAVAEKKPADARDALARTLRSRDPIVRAEVAQQLGALGAAGTVDLVRAADDEDAHVREAAMAGLAKVRDRRALELLARYAHDGKDARRQIAALRALPILASKWAWQARGDVAAGERMRERAREVVAGVARTADNAAALDDVAQALAR